MTDETTRIPVPTNGRGPKAKAGGGDAGPGADAGAAGAASAAVLATSVDAAVAPQRGIPPGVAAGTDLRIAFSPAQAVKGFAVVAGLVAIVLGIRRRRGR